MEVEVTLNCGCKETAVIEAAVFSPKIGDEMKCQKHGAQKVMQVGKPYHVSIGIKTKMDSNQKRIDE